MEGPFTTNILLLANCASYLVVGLKQALGSHNANIIEMDSKREGIRNIVDEIHAIIIYADSSIMERDDLVVYAKDYASEKGIKIFLIGSPEELAMLLQKVTVNEVEEKFTRPIDVNEVAEYVANYISTHNSTEMKSILAVDDSSVFLREINSWFSEKYKVALVNSGLNAIKYLGSHRPDLILLDYEMPVCNGKQVLEMIRSDTECGDIPVMFLTSNGGKDTILEIMPLNVAGYLLKTQSATEIKKAVDDFFEKKK